MRAETHKLARNSDPATSHMAATRVREFMATHNGAIMVALHAFGPMTVDQIAAQSGLQSQAINKRLPELARLGLAAPTGDMLPSQSGRMARVWGVA